MPLYIRFERQDQVVTQGPYLYVQVDRGELEVSTNGELESIAYYDYEDDVWVFESETYPIVVFDSQ